MASSRSAAPPADARPPRRPAGTARIDPAAWARLDRASSLDELAAPWLALQVSQLDAAGGAVFAAGTGGPLLLARCGEVAIDELATIAAAVAESARPTAIRAGAPGAPGVVAHPVVLRDRVEAVALIALANPNPSRLRTAARALLWGSAWLRERAASRAADRSVARLATMRQTHEAFAAVLEEDRFTAAVLGAVTRLAHVSGSDRVSFGLRRRERTRIQAVSHSAEFGQRMALNRRVAAAMDEAIDQRAALVHPAGEDEVNATRAQDELSRAHGPSSVLTVPFLIGGLHRGAVTFERPAAAPFTPDEVARLDFMVAMLGPVLHEKRENDRWIVAKIGQSARTQAVRLLGPRYPGRKAAALALAGLAVLFLTWTGTYQVTADATVEGAVERSIVAPFDGYLRAAPHRAGDTVSAGEIVAALDERDLALERLRWMTEKRQRELEFGRAIGEQARSETGIIGAQIAQADAQIRLIDAQLARAAIAAPFDGVIVSGDQSQNIGGAVRRGDVLFEIAPLEGYRIVMEVDETRIGDVVAGQTGSLVVAALPGESFGMSVERLTPVAIAADGRNFFRTEARLAGAPAALRPGMSGVGKIDVDERLMIEIWTRAMADWLRLNFWKWFG